VEDHGLAYPSPFTSRVASRFNTLPPISSGMLNGVLILWNLSLTGRRVSEYFPIAKPIRNLH
jgi:hypothetical protein